MLCCCKGVLCVALYMYLHILARRLMAAKAGLLRAFLFVALGLAVGEKVSNR